MNGVWATILHYKAIREQELLGLERWNDWCFRPQFCTARLYLEGVNLGKWDEVQYESCPWSRIDRPVKQQSSVLPLYHGCPPFPSLYRTFHFLTLICSTRGRWKRRSNVWLVRERTLGWWRSLHIVTMGILVCLISWNNRTHIFSHAWITTQFMTDSMIKIL